jgi:uncharacterized protein
LSGDIVRVKVLDVDKLRKRIALTLRLDSDVGRQPEARADDAPRSPTPNRKESKSDGAVADALRRAGVTGGKDWTNRVKPR